MLKNKNIIITGASAGLGQALACSLARLGANLSLAARRLDKLEELKQGLLAQYPQIKILCVATDVCDASSVQNLIKQSAEYFGSIDIIIANAGQSMWTRFRDLESPEQIKDLMQLNFMGLVYSAFYGLDYLRLSRGSFVGISSLQAVIPVPYHTGYVASKYAVNGFLETLRMEEPDIHILVAMPAWVGGTELRTQALISHSAQAIHVNKHHGRKVVSAQECADIIIQALIEQKREIFIPKIYQAVPLIKQLFPKALESFIKSRTDEQLEA